MARRAVTIRHIYDLFRQGQVTVDRWRQTTKWGNQEVRFRIQKMVDGRDIAALAVIDPRPESGIYVISVFEVYQDNGGCDEEN